MNLRPRMDFRWFLLSASVLVLPACAGGANRHYLQQSQLRAQQMYRQNLDLAGQAGGMSQSLGALAAEKQRLEQQNQALQANLDLANQRLTNLQSGNDQLEAMYRDKLTSNSRESPLSQEQTRKLEELRRKYPEFEFDPQTGVSKFSTDLLFASGSDDITARSQQILSEFAQIMNSTDARDLRILIVGHTDDKPIGRPATRQQHQTNWHLSTDRATAVVLALKKAGIAEHRMGAAGYSMFQPVTPNANDNARQLNRRVEIFVLAPDASIAGWEEPSKPAAAAAPLPTLIK